MKRLVALVMTLVCLFSCMSAFAADVSGYEAHATIDLTPFKGDNYTGSFNEISYTAQIKSAKEITMNMDGYEYTLSTKIKMNTINGVEGFYPQLHFASKDYTAAISGFYCVIGENRYLLEAEMDNVDYLWSWGHITIGAYVFSVLKEIANTKYPVKLCVAGKTMVYTFTDSDIAAINQFVTDIEASGLSKKLPYNDTVIIITNYNE